MSEQVKLCPFCAEEINIDAVKCKHCKEFLDNVKTEVATPNNPLKQIENLANHNYVQCDACSKSLSGHYSKSFLGFHKYTCAVCGYTTMYPLGESYEAIYQLAVVFFVFWLFIFLFVNMSVFPGVLAVLGFVGIPVLLHNWHLKSEHPNYKIEEYNSRPKQDISN